MIQAAETQPAVREAYRLCEVITRERAANFYYGIRLLPPSKRRAMCAVYAFARQVDDIGDGHEAPERKLVMLAEARDELAREDGGAVRVALADAQTRFELPIDALGDLIDGVEMDVRGTEYVTFEQLVVYCRRVAGSIGRLCLAIFGSADPARAMPLADDLGVAMQLTNILRDVREDLERGRVYLPLEDRQRFGCEHPLRASREDFSGLVRLEAERAGRWFDRGLVLLSMIDGRSASCVGAMTGIYRRILERIDSDPQAVFEGRVSLPPWEKTWVALRSLAGSGKP